MKLRYQSSTTLSEDVVERNYGYANVGRKELIRSTIKMKGKLRAGDQIGIQLVGFDTTKFTHEKNTSNYFPQNKPLCLVLKWKCIWENFPTQKKALKGGEYEISSFGGEVMRKCQHVGFFKDHTPRNESSRIGFPFLGSCRFFNGKEGYPWKKEDRKMSLKSEEYQKFYMLLHRKDDRDDVLAAFPLNIAKKNLLGNVQLKMQEFDLPCIYLKDVHEEEGNGRRGMMMNTEESVNAYMTQQQPCMNDERNGRKRMNVPERRSAIDDNAFAFPQQQQLQPPQEYRRRRNSSRIVQKEFPEFQKREIEQFCEQHPLYQGNRRAMNVYEEGSVDTFMMDQQQQQQEEEEEEEGRRSFVGIKRKRKKEHFCRKKRKLNNGQAIRFQQQRGLLLEKRVREDDIRHDSRFDFDDEMESFNDYDLLFFQDCQKNEFGGEQFEEREKEFNEA